MISDRAEAEACYARAIGIGSALRYGPSGGLDFKRLSYFALKESAVLQLTISGGREFHWSKILFVRKYCLAVVTNLSFNSFKECPRVRPPSCRVNKCLIGDCSEDKARKTTRRSPLTRLADRLGMPIKESLAVYWGLLLPNGTLVALR
jgi:hypothetical protein